MQALLWQRQAREFLFKLFAHHHLCVYGPDWSTLAHSLLERGGDPLPKVSEMFFLHLGWWHDMQLDEAGIIEVFGVQCQGDQLRILLEQGSGWRRCEPVGLGAADEQASG